MKKWILFACVVLILGTGGSSWGQNLPNPMQIYRFFKHGDNARAGNMKWTEIWENYNGTDREWFILEADFNTRGAIFEWHYVVGLGNNPPIHIKDGEYQPTNVNIWNVLQQGNVFNNANMYQNNLPCNSSQTGVINGIPSIGCEFTDVSLPGYFDVRPPATSTLQAWQATVNNFPVRYLFEAQGTYEQVSHRYELFQQAIPITEPENAPFNCFAGNFPTPPNTIIGMRNAFRWTLFSESRSIDLEPFFEENLDIDWVFYDSWQDNRRYRKQLDNGSICTLTLEYTQLSDSQYLTAITATVFIETDDVDMPNMLESVIQSMYHSPLSYPGTVPEVLSSIVGASDFSGWVRRDELSVIYPGSAFVTITNGIEEHYIVLDANEDQFSTHVRLFKRPLITPPFDHAQLVSTGN